MKPIKLSIGEKNLVLTLISNCRDEGWYYGNKEQFQSGLTSIETKLMRSVNLCKKPAVSNDKEIWHFCPNCGTTWTPDCEAFGCQQCGIVKPR